MVGKVLALVELNALWWPGGPFARAHLVGACLWAVVTPACGGNVKPAPARGDAALDGAARVGNTCGCAFNCCGTTCVNFKNDFQNCGSCGHECPGPNPFCDNGVCGVPACINSCAPGTLCCGFDCCVSGQICCRVGGTASPPTCGNWGDRGTCGLGCKGLCL
jgi:hypothetical protein